MDAAVHPQILEETPPNIVVRIFTTAMFTIQDYGWYMLAAALMGLYVWKRAKPHIDKWVKDKEDREFYSKYHKDPDLFQARLASQEAARLRLQEKYAADAALAEEKRKTMEQKKREEFIDRHSGTSKAGYRLGDGSSGSNQRDEGTNKKKPLRPDFSPLSGGGMGGGYRPSRRSCPGGGCG